MKFTGGPVNANRGFSAVLHARATRGILFSYGSIARARLPFLLLPTITSYLGEGEGEGGREYSSFAETILPCIDSNGALLPSPSSPSQIFPAPVDMIPENTTSCIDRYDFFASCF